MARKSRKPFSCCLLLLVTVATVNETSFLGDFLGKGNSDFFDKMGRSFSDNGDVFRGKGNDFLSDKMDKMGRSFGDNGDAFSKKGNDFLSDKMDKMARGFGDYGADAFSKKNNDFLSDKMARGFGDDGADAFSKKGNDFLSRKKDKTFGRKGNDDLLDKILRENGADAFIRKGKGDLLDKILRENGVDAFMRKGNDYFCDSFPVPRSFGENGDVLISFDSDKTRVKKLFDTGVPGKLPHNSDVLVSFNDDKIRIKRGGDIRSKLHAYDDIFISFEDNKIRVSTGTKVEEDGAKQPSDESGGQGFDCGVQTHLNINPLHCGTYAYAERYVDIAEVGPFSVGVSAGAESGGGLPDGYAGFYIEWDAGEKKLGFEIGWSTDGPFVGPYAAVEADAPDTKIKNEIEDQKPESETWKLCRNSPWHQWC